MALNLRLRRDEIGETITGLGAISERDFHARVLNLCTVRTLLPFTGSLALRSQHARTNKDRSTHRQMLPFAPHAFETAISELRKKIEAKYPYELACAHVLVRYIE